MQEIIGKVIAIMDIKEGISQSTGKKWALQQFVLETLDQYHRRILLELFGEEKIKLYDIHISETLTVVFNINAKENNGKWYNTFNVQNITKTSGKSPELNQSEPADDIDFIFNPTIQEKDPPF